MAPMPTPCTFVLQRVYERLHVLDVLNDDDDDYCHNLSMGCFRIFCLHKAFLLCLYPWWVGLCLQNYICLSGCVYSWL